MSQNRTPSFAVAPLETDGPAPAAGEEAFPVSYAQQRLWLLDRMLPGGAIYNVGQVQRLVGLLDVEALARAVAEVVRRQESLRTRFSLRDGVPLQVVTPPGPVALVVEEVAGATAGERTAAALRLAQAEAQVGFDLERGPLWRVRLLRLGPVEHWLQWTLHHIVTDGWSMGVLAREVSLLYAAGVEAGAAGAEALPGLPVQYVDYAVWQRQWLQGEVLARQLEYWQEALAQLPVLSLPTDRRRPLVSSYRGGRVAVVVGEVLTRGLKALSRREGATLFMTLLAAFQVLLSRYSGQEDVAVGVPTAGRSRPEVEGLIGFFVNMLVLRGDLSGAPGFTTYLGRVRERALAAYAHQEVPFERLVEALAPKRDLSRNPLFQVSMVLHNTPPAQWRLPGLEVERVAGVSSDSAKFDLTLSLVEREGRLEGNFEYACDLFEARTIERMAGHWQVLLDGIVAAPEQSIGRLPLLSAAERGQVLALGQGAGPVGEVVCVHEGIAAQAARTPAAVAVVQGARELSYGELDARANQLAHQLRALGVGPDVLVGLCLPRSLELVVGMLGILKAGGAYVPLDPEYPVARLALMLEDTAAPVLVTRGEWLARWPRYGGSSVCLERDAARLAAQPRVAPACGVTPAHLAYVIYTSGSTGQPKGVRVRHASVAGLVGKSSYITVTPQDTIAHASNIAFDAATFEVWAALVNGARIAILERDELLAPAALVRAIERYRVSCMFLTTALFNAVAAEDPHAFGALRVLLFGGEAHDPKRVRDVMLATPPRHLVHVYGPTETTTFATFHEVRAADAGGDIPIGRPIMGAEAFVLDACGEPAPRGVVGDLHIGGAGVADGYLARPEESRERFVAHPLEPDGERRVFRSGDLVRWNAEGNLEYVGRNDAQVKIRGFRVEPGEIAAELRRHPRIRAAHVIARRDPGGTLRMTAYFVPADGSADVAPLELHRYLTARMPAFMVPPAFVAMTAFPVTANGKLDDGAFPAPDDAHVGGASAYAAPRGATEEALCRIWSEALGLARVGIDDDFFALGGHSLLAARVFSRIDEDLGRFLPLAALFECPTVRQLAERLEQGATPDSASLVVINRDGTLPSLYAVSGVFGDVVGFADLARALGPRQPFYALQSVGLDGTRPPLQSIEAMAQHYLAEVRAAQPHGPYAFVGVCFGATVAYEMARQVMADGETVACLGLLDPTRREGGLADRVDAVAPPLVYRATSLARLARSRFALYREEMRTLNARQRSAYLLAKLRVVARRIGRPGNLDVLREMHRREVVRCNVAALDRYRRRPLEGALRLLAIVETVRPGRSARARDDDWQRWWAGRTIRERAPGADSGEMLSAMHAPHVAAMLARYLQVAFGAAGPQSPAARHDSSATVAD